jgi:hypothetical protein
MNLWPKSWYQNNFMEKIVKKKQQISILNDKGWN